MISDVQSEKTDHNFSGFFKVIIPTYIVARFQINRLNTEKDITIPWHF